MHIHDGPPITLPRPLPPARPAAPPASGSGDVYVPSARPADDPPPAPGARRDFWAWDFAVMPPASKPIHATLRSVGEHACIWVDDAAWGQQVRAEDVAILEDRFNRHAPSGAVDPTKGVYANDTAYFGEPPHAIDKDPRVAVLLTPFAVFNGTSLDGYFNAFDQMPDQEAWEKYQQHSNERNIIYLNTAGSPVAGDYVQGVLAHEFSHLLQFGSNPDQAGWLGESMAEVAMAINGYHTDYGHVTRHQAKPGSPLESDTYVDYGAGYLFGTYLLERYGKPFISALSAQPGAGRDAVEATMRKAGDNQRFGSLVADWVVANYADSRGVIAPGHQYASLDPPAPAETVLAQAGDRAAGTLAPTGAAYVRIDRPQSLRFSGDGDVALRLMRFDGERLSVQDVDPSQPLSAPQGSVLAVAAVGASPVHYAVESL